MDYVKKKKKIPISSST